MKTHILTLIIGFAGIINIDARNTEAKNALSHVDNHFFIENKGQWPDEVLYLTSIRGLDAWITKNGILYDFNKLEEIQNEAKIDNVFPDKFKEKDYTRIGHKILYKLLGNNSHVHAEGKEKQAAYYNYFIGNDPGRHATDVGLFKEVMVKNAYDGIDIRYYFDNGNIRYDYLVHPGADPSQISFVLEGTDKTYLNLNGDLVFNTRFGELALAGLHTYQETMANKIASSFVKTENGWSIVVGNYNNKQTLIIDPLIYSTYLGGNGVDVGRSIAIDASGNAYVTGTTKSTNYDVSTGAYQRSYAGNIDVFVTKLNATGTALVYSTYLGGSEEDGSYSIAVDTSGNAYLAGCTYSFDFVVTSGAYQTSHAGGNNDVFVTKLNATGRAVLYSTYLGGGGDEAAYSIAIDANRNVYVVGATASNNFDTTSGAYQTNFAGQSDVFVTKLNTTGSTLVYSTYIGGTGDDYGSSIAIDTSCNVYFTGTTRSNNYDITSGSYQTSVTGNISDCIVTKLNTTGTALVYSTYLGGNDADVGCSIAIDALGNAYIAGYTLSVNFDTTLGAYKTSITTLWGEDAFVTKLNPTGTALVYSTYLGGSSVEYSSSIAIDFSGNAYVVGTTFSENYDTTSGAYQTRRKGTGTGGFLTKLNTTGTNLVYSTYLGGNDGEGAYSVAIDEIGNPYITGETWSMNYDTTSGAYQTSHAGGYRDAFVTKMCLFKDSTTINLSSSAGTDTQSLCINTAIIPIKYTTTDATGANFIGLPAGITGSFASNTVTISGTPTLSGKFYYTVHLNGGCGTTNAKGVITVNPENTIKRSSASGTDSQTLCINKAITGIRYTTKGATGASFTGLPTGVTGSFIGNNLVNISGKPTSSGVFSYTITLTGGCGTVSTNGIITVNPDNTIGLSSALGSDSQSLCINTAIADITYTTTGATGVSITGLPPGVTDSFAANKLTLSGTPSSSGVFSYTITLTGGCETVITKGSITVNPDNTIGLSSAFGTNSQSVCINTAIADITYATTNATGASVTGLPAGVTGSFAANMLTISGTPTANGIFPYTISLTGGCGTVSSSGSITVNSNVTIGLSSVLGTDSQSLCVNTSITDITYATTSATSASVTGLPAGVTGNFVANTFTIRGSPSVKGTFSYTVTLSGVCGTVNAKGKIIVNPDNTIRLTSALGTDSQSVCINTAIADITYATTSTAVTGLPAGVTGSFASNMLTISGIPTSSGIYPYTITGACGTVNAKGNIIVNPDNTIGLTSALGTDSQSVKVNTPIANITYATRGATGVTLSGLPIGVTESFASDVVTISGTPTAQGTFSYTITLAGGCGTKTANGSIIVGGLGIANQANVQALQLYPNPANTEISIKGVFNPSVSIEIIDASGRTSQAVYSIDSNSIKLQVSSLAEGMYWIRIVDDVHVFHCKIIVQH